MTNEPKSKNFDVLHFIADNAGLSTFEAIEKAYSMGVSNQETSDDCVSRAEVLNQLKEWRDCEFVKMTNPYHYLEKRIQSMSPVTPTRKVGKWIVTDSYHWYGINEEIQKVDLECSCCQGWLEWNTEELDNKPKYCLYCGAAMKEGGE